MKRWVPLVLLLALLAAIGIGLSPRGRLLDEALAILVDIWRMGGGSDGRTASGAGDLPAGGVSVSTIPYAGPGGERRRADLYCAGGTPPLARLLMVHGLVAAGKDDPRLGVLGRTFARRRFLVMVPDFPGMRALRVGEGDIAEVRAALLALGSATDCAGGAPVPASAPAGSRPLQTGVVGFSYSAGPVLLALDQPRRLADFAVLFGGYFDLGEVIRFLTTGRYGEGGAADRDGEALPEGRWIILGANADALPEPADRAALLAISRRRQALPAAGIDDLAARLGPSGRAALDLLANTDPARFDRLLQAIDPGLRGVLAALSPSKSLSRPLGVDLYILHGRSDSIVPYTQSVELARSVRTTGTVRLVLLGGFRHARPDRQGEAPWWSTALRYPADSLHLIGILEEVLGRRGRKSLTGDGPDRP